MAQVTELRGAVLGKGYRLRAQLNAGEDLFAATHELIPGHFVVRLFPPESLARPEASSRIQRGARVASLLRDPHALQILDFSASGEVPAFVVTERTDGAWLTTVMAEEGMFPVPRVVEIVEAIAKALEAAHHIGLVHGDLRPAHILLPPAGAGPAAMVAGFGWAKELRAAARVPAPSGYLAPEQHFGRVLNLDERVDQFGLAALAYEMIAACLPFTEESADLASLFAAPRVPPPIADVVPGIPKALDDVLGRALSHSPSDRFPELGEMVAKLREAATGGVKAVLPAPKIAAAAAAAAAVAAAPAPARAPGVVAAKAVAAAVTAGDAVPARMPRASSAPTPPVLPGVIPEAAVGPRGRGMAPAATASDVTEELDLSTLAPVMDSDAEEVASAPAGRRGAPGRGASFSMGTPAPLAADGATQIRRSPFLDDNLDDDDLQEVPDEDDPTLELSLDDVRAPGLTPRSQRGPAAQPSTAPNAHDTPVDIVSADHDAWPEALPVVIAPTEGLSSGRRVTSQPVVLATPPPVEPRAAGSRWMIPVAAIAGVLAVAGIIYLARGPNQPREAAAVAPAAPAAPSPSPLPAPAPAAPAAPADKPAAPADKPAAPSAPAVTPTAAPEIEQLPPREAAASDTVEARAGRGAPGTDRGVARRKPPSPAVAHLSAARPAPPPAADRPAAAAGACSLHIESKPWAQIWIDGRNTGRRTPVDGLPIACGNHRLLLKRPDRDIEQMEVIKVEAGQPFSESYELE